MELNRQWCDNPRCRTFGKLEAGNVQVYSYMERRYYCTTCIHTWSADHGTCFETLRSPRQRVVETVAELGERVSLRATGRLRHHTANTVLKWLDLAGAHTVAVSADVLRDLHLTYAQVDELWTFVKKNRRIWNPMIRRTGAICGFGAPWPCLVGCGWSAI